MTTPTNAGDGVSELVAQREQLRAWISKLNEVQTGAPSRVAERVRADYQERLRRVTEELSAHAEEVQRSLESVRAELDAAEERRAQAVDALEETRLRHLIGELDEAAWDRARAPLEQDVATAEEALAHTRAEVERLSTLSAEIGGGVMAEPEPEMETAGDEDEDDDAPPVFAYAPDDDAADEPEMALDEEDLAEAGDDELGLDADAAAAQDELDLAGGPVSGDELAAWISEVESEASADDEPAAWISEADAGPSVEESAVTAEPRDETSEAWDPFANEFGGAPANPTTQPGDATQDLPWLDSIDGGAAGKWAAPRQEGGGQGDELAFLDNLEADAPAGGEAGGTDLAADDLAFLEELDRAISGGGQRPAAASAQPASGGLDGFEGGSGGGGLEAGAADATQEQRKRGEALLCKECGAINEPQAWYCEICGSEL